MSACSGAALHRNGEPRFGSIQLKATSTAHSGFGPKDRALDPGGAWALSMQRTTVPADRPLVTSAKVPFVIFGQFWAGLVIRRYLNPGLY